MRFERNAAPIAGKGIAEAVLVLCSNADHKFNEAYLAIDGGRTAAASTGAAR